MLDPRFREAIVAAAHTYQDLGIRAALIGGLAAGAYGRPRATRDIDFLVGDEAWTSKGVILSIKPGVPQMANGIPVDNIPFPNEYRGLYDRALHQAIESDVSGVLILQPEMVAVTKLAGGRSKDIASVVDMMEAESIDLAELEKTVSPYSKLRAMFDRAVSEWRQGDGE